MEKSENRGRENGVSVEDTGTEGEVCGGHVGGHALLSPSFWPEFILPWRVSPICSSAEQQLCRSRCCCTPPHLLTVLTPASEKIIKTCLVLLVLVPSAAWKYTESNLEIMSQTNTVSLIYMQARSRSKKTLPTFRNKKRKWFEIVRSSHLKFKVPQCQ